MIFEISDTELIAQYNHYIQKHEYTLEHWKDVII